MDNEREYGEREPLRQGIEQVGGNNGNWDAVGSLKKNAKRPDDEVSPLLSNSGSSSENSSNVPAVTAWEGKGDHEGLPWWQKPSVSLAHPGEVIHVLTSRSYTGYYHRSSSSPSHSEVSSSRN
jgi:hypothetical protein